MILKMPMRAIFVTVIGTLCMATVSCMPRQPDMSAYMIQQVQQGKPIVTEQGSPSDEARAKSIQNRVHSKQEIEKWFGKAPMAFPLHGQDPHGCTEGWSYNHMVTVSKIGVGAGGSSNNMGSEALIVFFERDGKVCRWSLTRQLRDMMAPISNLGRPIDVERTKKIQPGVQTKQDIETWFGKPTAMGFGDQPGDPKGCLDLWEYQNMTVKQGQSGGTVEVFRVKFNEQEKVCYSDYSSRGWHN